MKKIKNNVWSLHLRKKLKNYFFQIKHAPGIVDNFFFWLPPKDAKKKVLQVGKQIIWKTSPGGTI